MPGVPTSTFYPDNLTVPTDLLTDSFHLQPLRVTDVERDYEAVMESRELLRVWSGSPWPWEGFTLEDNLRDLAMHQREHENREAFTYTVLDSSETTCLGCVYITPLRSMLLRGGEEGAATTLAGSEAVVRFWARTSRLPDELDRQLYQTLEQWLESEWNFPRVLFRASDLDTRQVHLLSETRVLRYRISMTRASGHYLLYE